MKRRAPAVSIVELAELKSAYKVDRCTRTCRDRDGLWCRRQSLATGFSYAPGIGAGDAQNRMNCVKKSTRRTSSGSYVATLKKNC